ncbi:MAG: threonine synthase [Candidatus Methanomethylicia archaeon]
MVKYRLKCIECSSIYDDDRILCDCGGLLDVLYLNPPSDLCSRWMSRRIGVWRYFELLPINSIANIVSLGEGGTILYRCGKIREYFGLRELYVKNEGGNPTGSFKDRGMTVGISKAIEHGAFAVICASTGNTSASLAAYAARAGLKCFVILPHGKVALGKLSQAIIYGANIISVNGSFDEALSIVRKVAEKHRLYILNSINPFRLEGQKTIAYEIYDQLGSVPDVVVVPVGNAGNISAIFKGFVELKQYKLTESIPRMIGVQAEGASPIVNAFRDGLKHLEPIENPETIATAIRIGNPVNWKKALNAIYSSKGYAISVSDTEILEAQKLLARLEGIFVEPASAASIAGLRKLLEEKIIDRNDLTVCIATGHGLKDPNVVAKYTESITSVKSKEVSKVIKQLLKVNYSSAKT